MEIFGGTQWSNLLLGITIRFMRRIADSKKRLEVIQDSISNTHGLYFPLKLIRHEMILEKRKNNPDDYLVEEGDIESLKHTGNKLINSSLEKDTLLVNSNLDFILYMWEEIGDNKEMESWVTNLIDTKGGFLKLIKGFLHHGHSYGDHVNIEYSMDFKFLNKLISVEVIEEKLIELQSENYADEKANWAIKTLDYELGQFRKGIVHDYFRGDGPRERIG